MNSRSFWDADSLEEKVAIVPENIAYYKPDHHFGRPFLTAYQLAILFKHRFPEDFDTFGHSLGGKGSGAHFSFTGYLAGQLSQRIRKGENTNIKVGFLSNAQLLKIQFKDRRETISSYLTGSQYNLSMFRLRDSNV